MEQAKLNSIQYITRFCTCAKIKFHIKKLEIKWKKTVWLFFYLGPSDLNFNSKLLPTANYKIVKQNIYNKPF